MLTARAATIGPCRLTRNFALGAAIIIVAAGWALAQLNRSLAVEQLERMAEANNSALTHALANGVWDRFDGFISGAHDLSADEIRARPETADLRREIETLMTGTPVVRIKLYVFVSDIGIAARGGSTDGTANAGNGAAVVLSAPVGSITAGTDFPDGLTVGVPLSFNGAIINQGGDNISTLGGNGGNGGAITVNAGGTVTLGTLTGDEAAGVLSAVSARGGNATAGDGGNAGRVSISGVSLALSGVYDQGGSSAPTLTGGNGEHMTLATTGGTGEVLVLAYTPGSGAGPSINADGGFSNGTQTGRGGQITIGGDVVATEAATLGAGTPTLALSSQGVGGTPFILVTGSMDASSPGAEALFIDSTGHVTVLGPIGANTPFSSVTIIGQ